MRIRFVIIFIALFAAALSAWSCADKAAKKKVHWFDCRPVLQKLSECGVQISFDGKETANPDEAYNSCQYAHGNMWLEMFRCYKLFPACSDLIECLPEHGFVRPPGDDTADDTSLDDTSADDTAGGSAPGDTAP